MANLAMIILLDQVRALVTDREGMEPPTGSGNLMRAKTQCHQIGNGFETLSRLADCAAREGGGSPFRELGAALQDMVKAMTLLNKAYFIGLRQSHHPKDGDAERLTELTGLHSDAETRLLLAHEALDFRMREGAF